MDSTERARLEADYLQLVKQRLPAAAREGRWVLRLDHCFGRVLLDAAVGGCWYDALDRRRAAYRQLTDEQLAGAVALGRRLLEEGDPLLRALDAQSLAWRGKPPKREPGTAAHEPAAAVTPAAAPQGGGRRPGRARASRRRAPPRTAPVAARRTSGGGPARPRGGG